MEEVSNHLKRMRTKDTDDSDTPPLAKKDPHNLTKKQLAKLLNHFKPGNSDDLQYFKKLTPTTQNLLFLTIHLHRNGRTPPGAKNKITKAYPKLIDAYATYANDHTNDNTKPIDILHTAYECLQEDDRYCLYTILQALQVLS